MRVLFATPELAPIVRSGGVGEGLAALARALSAQGAEVTAVLPRFARAERAESDVVPLREGEPLRVVGESVRVHEGTLGEVRVLVLDHAAFSHREEVYGEEVGDDANGAAFALFARAVVALLEARPFDVVHAHEWPTAMALYLAAQSERTRGVARVVTLHNLLHQGVFSPNVLEALGLDASHFHPAALEFYGRVNFLKGGILAADIVTTVSPTYARQIVLPEHGEMLEGVLAARAHSLVGVLNGIDDRAWDPATDAALPARFSAEAPFGKSACKAALLDELGLDRDSARPLVVSLGRIVEQKGVDLIAEALVSIVSHGATFVIAGEGDAHLEARLSRAVAEAEPTRAAFVGFADEPLAHRLIAAADLVVMPSRFEPCGIVQMYAQRYGALPVVRSTGGLADTVIDADASPEGTGFVFHEPSAAALVAAVSRATARLASSDGPSLRARVMRLDRSWRAPAARYLALYRDAIFTRRRLSTTTST